VRWGSASVYRRANAPNVRALLAQLPAGAEIRLWALDEPEPDLARWTVGTGPGGRLDLLNELVDAIDRSCDLLVLADDDVRFVAGDLSDLLRIGRASGLDLFQPAHSRLSRCAFDFTRKRPFVAVRDSTFVEQGPLVVLSTAAQQELLPLPAGSGMGWGVEVRWYEAAARLRLGVVDAVALRHDDGPGHGYDVGPERLRLQQELARVGAARLEDIQRELGRRRPASGPSAARRGGREDPRRLAAAAVRVGPPRRRALPAPPPEGAVG
jgi:hypothetical protein